MSAEADFLVVVTIVSTDPNLGGNVMTDEQFAKVSEKVEDQLSDKDGPLGDLPGTFSVVVANG